MEEQKEKVLAFIEDENYVPMKAKEIADLISFFLTAYRLKHINLR